MLEAVWPLLLYYGSDDRILQYPQAKIFGTISGDTTGYGSRIGHSTSEHIYGFTVGPANAQTVTVDACNSKFDVVSTIFRDGLDHTIARIDNEQSNEVPPGRSPAGWAMFA